MCFRIAMILFVKPKREMEFWTVCTLVHCIVYLSIYLNDLRDAVILGIRRNFMKVDLFYGELKYVKVEQQQAYDLAGFFSE